MRSVAANVKIAFFIVAVYHIPMKSMSEILSISMFHPGDCLGSIRISECKRQVDGMHIANMQ